MYCTSSQANIGNLFGAFKSEEIALTLERCTLNETTQSEVDCMESGMDETMMFRTLMPVAEPPPMPVTRSISYASLATKSPGRSVVHQTTTGSASKPNWSVRPRRLLLSLSNGAGYQQQTLTIRNDFLTTQTFQVQLSQRGLVDCRPELGIVEPGDEQQVVVRLKAGLRPTTQHVDEVLLTVFIESDKMDVLINVDRRPLLR